MGPILGRLDVSRVTILQRYMLRELLEPFGLGLGVFTFVFLVGQLYRILDLLMNQSVRPLVVIELILALLPGILSLTIPMALLVAVLLSVGRLAADREILAIRMSGVNLVHIFWPVLGVAATAAFLMILGNQKLVPFLNLKSTDLAIQIEFDVLSSIPPNRFFELDTAAEGQSSVFFYEKRDTVTGDMKHINIKTTIEPKTDEPEKAREKQLRERMKTAIKSNDQKTLAALRKELQKIEQARKDRKVNESLICANQGRIDADLAARMISIHLTTGSIHFVDPDRPTAYNIIRFDEMRKGIRPRMTRTEEGAYEKAPREMSTAELRTAMTNSSKPGRYYTELLQRFSIPLACIAFVLIGFPLAVYVKPTGKAIAFAISFFLILLYYGLLNYGISLGRTGSTMAGFAIFFPNILLALVGSFLLYRMVMK